MNALVDLFHTARQLRSFGLSGDLRLPVSPDYAQLIVMALFQNNMTTTTVLGLGAEIAVEFRSFGTVILEVKEPA